MRVWAQILFGITTMCVCAHRVESRIKYIFILDFVKEVYVVSSISCSPLFSLETLLARYLPLRSPRGEAEGCAHNCVRFSLEDKAMVGQPSAWKKEAPPCVN